MKKIMLLCAALLALAAPTGCKSRINDENKKNIIGEWVPEKEYYEEIENGRVIGTEEYIIEHPMDTFRFLPNGEYHPKCYYTVYDTLTNGVIDTFSYYSPIIIGDYTIDDKVISIVWDEDWNELDSIVELTPNKLVYVEHLIDEDIHLRITKTLRKVK